MCNRHKLPVEQLVGHICNKDSLALEFTLGLSISFSQLPCPNCSPLAWSTAGGAYLLSAKQRYNDRVTKGIKGYLALEASLKGGSVAEAQAYFAGDDVGTWGDISTAGYLLANAFRRNSTQSPDSLPSVKVGNRLSVDLE